MGQLASANGVTSGHTSETILAQEVNVAYLGSTANTTLPRLSLEWQLNGRWWPHYRWGGYRADCHNFRSAFPVRWRLVVEEVDVGQTVDYVVMALD